MKRERERRRGDDKQTVRCLFVELAQDDDGLVYVRVYCACVCARVCPEIFSFFFLLALKQKDDDAVLAARNRDPTGRDVFFIDIFFEKKEKRETLVVAAESAVDATVAFVPSTDPIIWRDSLFLSL